MRNIPLKLRNASPSIRPGIALWAYVLIVFLGAAAVAPWVHHALQSANFGDVPFRRIVNRCLLILALLGIWPLIRSLQIRSLSEIGLRPTRPISRDLTSGVLIGSIILICAGAASLLAGGSVFDSAFSKRAFFSALGPALIVPIIEEILFRGAVFTSLRKTWNTSVAVWMSSAIYAIVHFFARPENPAKVEWTSGFTILGGMLAGFTDFHTVIPGFLTLTILGVLFALTFLRTGALYVSMGIHAALIFWSKLFASLTHPAPGANVWFWGTDKLVDGWISFLLLAAATIVFWRRPARA